MFILVEVDVVDAYCFKCKAKREISNPVHVTFKNGREATRGTCPVCATKVFRIRKGESSLEENRSQKRGLLAMLGLRR